MGNYDRRKSTPCRDCLRCLKWIPVIFIVAIIGWSYYAYVFQLCLFSIDSTVQKIIFIALYHIVGVLFLWSYWNTIFTPVGTVPHKWRIPESEIERLIRAENQEQQKRMLENFAKDLPITNRTLQGAIRFCEKCQIIKPDRAHHCSVCGTCVLKMDHHCPWVNNCVNFKNYKFFVLFLGYALLYCLYVALTSLQYFIEFWRGELNGGMGRFHILFLFFVSLMFAISLVSLFGYHIYLVLVNRTTLEAFRAPVFRIGGADKNGFNLGKYANFQEVFGDNWKLWLIPVYTSLGDGLIYPTQGHHQSSSYESMGDTQTRLDQPTDKFLNQPIDNLPALVNNDNGNADASLSSTNNAANNSNIANGNFIIDMPSSNNSSDHHAKIFVVNERIIDDASELNNQNQLLTQLDERNANTEAPESVPEKKPLAGAPKTHEQNEQNPASIIDI